MEKCCLGRHPYNCHDATVYSEKVMSAVTLLVKQYFLSSKMYWSIKLAMGESWEW